MRKGIASGVGLGSKQNESAICRKWPELGPGMFHNRTVVEVFGRADSRQSAALTARLVGRRAGEMPRTRSGTSPDTADRADSQRDVPCGIFRSHRPGLSLWRVYALLHR